MSFLRMKSELLNLIRNSICLVVIFWAFSLVRGQNSSPSTTTLNPHLILSNECRQQQSNCTDSVYPYLNDPQYMFPTSLDHVNEMCKMWSKFVDCIRRYISNCFEENRRILFHKSVENSIDTVHAICSSKLYQTEYLMKANCFKQVSMDHCGPPYHQLIDNIANPMAKDEHICCSYAQFKQCVNRPLLDECGRKAKNLMDHSMSFLISRCEHYSYQKQTECPQVPFAKSKIDEPTRVAHRIEYELDGNIVEHTSDRLPPPVHPESREWPTETIKENEEDNIDMDQDETLTYNNPDNDNNNNKRHSVPNDFKHNHMDNEQTLIYTIKPVPSGQMSPLKLSSSSFSYRSSSSSSISVSLYLFNFLYFILCLILLE